MTNLSDKLEKLQERVKRTARVDKAQPTGWKQVISFLRTLTNLGLYSHDLERWRTASSFKRYVMQKMIAFNTKNKKL